MYEDGPGERAPCWSFEKLSDVEGERPEYTRQLAPGRYRVLDVVEDLLVGWVITRGDATWIPCANGLPRFILESGNSGAFPIVEEVDSWDVMKEALPRWFSTLPSGQYRILDRLQARTLYSFTIFYNPDRKIPTGA
jgi:hypothetical protein